MKWLIINTEAFSPSGLKQKKLAGTDLKGRKKKNAVVFSDLPWIVRKFLSVFPAPFIILDESSRIKVNVPMKETDKSMRTQLIKLLNNVGHRCIMTGTLMSKSPLNVVDQYNFLREGYFPESMWEIAERYCVMMTIRVGRGRRVCINKKDYDSVRKRLRNAYVRGGDMQLEAAKESIFRQFGIDYAKQEHIIRHRKYTPFINVEELTRRIAPDTMFVKREDVFDITFDKFVKEPIMRPVQLSREAKTIANNLIEFGFTDKLILGKAAALELMLRLQDICNGFEPVEADKFYDQKDWAFPDQKPKREIVLRPLKENPKVEALLELLEEIDVERNQVVVWSSRTALIKVAGEAFEKEGISYVRYDGKASDKEKADAEKEFEEKRCRVFLANQASGAYGLNCLAQCSYMLWLCVDGSVEKYYQAQHRILRGALSAPKFAYAIYAEGSVEERQWEALRVGQELLAAENQKETFMFV